MIRKASRNSSVRLIAQRPSEDVDLVALALRGKFTKSAKLAIRMRKAKGIPVTYKQGNQIIKEFSDGRKEVLGTIQGQPFRIPKGVRVIGK